jgi:DivIVA domain-containing protein
LRPWQVRGRQFTIIRRGLDPAEVNLFLDRVATDLASVCAELASSQEESVRIKNALREWQSRQASTMYELARR